MSSKTLNSNKLEYEAFRCAASWIASRASGCNCVDADKEPTFKIIFVSLYHSSEAGLPRACTSVPLHLWRRLDSNDGQTHVVSRVLCMFSFSICYLCFGKYVFEVFLHFRIILWCRLDGQKKRVTDMVRRTRGPSLWIDKATDGFIGFGSLGLVIELHITSH